uniref:Uncharacterized protein n=1 Tax=Daphnia galeata TaxID=27404 RepID=A0A8J2RH92_9CRUS|nr:unnamed protein product [Daphnia galeata]
MTSVNPDGGRILFQPVMMVPVNTTGAATGRQINYPKMKVIAIRIFSAICIVLGIASIGVQIAALVIYATSLFNCVISQMDVAGHGIWAGALYLTTGSLAIAASHKRTQSLMVGTVVFAVLSICASIAASTLAGIAAAHGIYSSCYYISSSFSSLCDAWRYLEWTLLAISIAAFFSTLTLIFLMSLGLFGKRKSSKNTEADAVRPDNVNQKIYLKQQSNTVMAASNLHVVYVAQENQQAAATATGSNLRSSSTTITAARATG